MLILVYHIKLLASIIFEKYLQYYPSKKLLCRIYVAMVESGIISMTVKDKFDFTDAYCSDSVRNVFKIISRY